MQQKYCDQGRSTAVLTSTCPTCRARSSWGCGGKPKKASICPCAKSSSGLTEGSVTQWKSLPGSRPTWPAISVSNAGSSAATRLPLSSPITMNILPSEQFEATDVDAGDQDNRCAGVDILNEVGDKGHAEIGFAAAHRRPLGVHRHFD